MIGLLTSLALKNCLQSGFSEAIYRGETYTKHEYRIPMRDGVKLYVSAYVPNDGTNHPILLERTPYSAGPYGKSFRGFPGGEWSKAGYILAWEDVRGKYESEGVFEDIRPELGPNHPKNAIDESTDTSDTIDFLVSHVPNNNGKVGLWGISYPGFYAEVGAINTNPHLAAVSPQAPVSEWFKGDDWHHNGVLFIQDAFDFMGWFGTVQTHPTPIHSGISNIDRRGLSAYDFYLQTGTNSDFNKKYYKNQIPFWNEVLSHPNYDQWWKDRSVPSHLINIHCPMLFVGGLFDAEDMYGALHSYAAAKAQNPTTPVYLAMGPWFHGMWAYGLGSSLGDLDYGQPTAKWFRDNIQFPFFQKYLNNQSEQKISPVTVYQTGENQWQLFNQWPPQGTTEEALFLDSNKSISTSKPQTDTTDSYVNDPNKPTPYLEDMSSKERPVEYMLADQTFASKQPDVLTYESEPLSTDTTFAGPVKVELWVSTTGTDGDFVVKLIDVYPPDSKQKNPHGDSMSNKEILIRGDIMRGKFRKSFSEPSPFEPGKPTLVPFEMNSIFHTFKKGHRYMIQIQSDWFPLCDRNPNVFENINAAKIGDYQKATITIFHGAKYPSRLILSKLESQ